MKKQTLTWLFCIALALGFSACNSTNSSKKESNETTINLWKTTNSNLITPTSIAGVEVFGKTPEKVKEYLNSALTWEDGQVYNGETLLVIFGYDSGVIEDATFFDSSFVTKEGIRVGSTSGDLLQVYPNAKVLRISYGEHYSIELTYIGDEGITYYYDWDENGTVGEYAHSADGDDYEEVSQIVNKNVSISYIQIEFDENGNGD